MNTLDINPMRNNFSTGFIAFSDITTPVSIDISATNIYLTANGSQKTNIVATMLDSNGDPCPNQGIIFSLPNGYISYMQPIGNGVVTATASGNPISIKNTTNGKGQARCAYWPISGQSGSQVVYATWSGSSSVQGFVVINQLYNVGTPFELDVSRLDQANYLE